MRPADKKPRKLPAPAPEEDEEQPSPELAQATVLGMSLDDLASRTTMDEGDGEVDPSADGQATRMLDVSASPPPRRTSTRLKRASKPMPVEDPGSTAPSLSALEDVDPNATRMLSADVLPPPEVARPSRPSSPAAGAFSRQQAKAEKDKPRTSKVVRAQPAPDAAAPNAVAPNAAAGGKWLVPAVAFGLIAAFVITLGVVRRERVPVVQLQALYPYGYAGARGPHGQPAPGAEEVDYSYQGSVECSTHVECLRFRFEAGGFSGGMVIGREPNGLWIRVADEDLPFPATAPKEGE